MKFGQNLHHYQIIEWAPFYIDYQALKQLFKAAKSLVVDQREDPDLTGLPHIILTSSDLKGAQTLELSWSKTCRKPGLSTRTSMQLFGGE